MRLQAFGALVAVELKKLYRDPMTLAVLLLMPIGLTLVFYLALRDVANDSYSYASQGISHFEYCIIRCVVFKRRANYPPFVDGFVEDE